MTGRELRGVLVAVSGVAELVTVADDWRALAAQVDAQYIESVSTPIPGVVMIVDEDGIARDQPLNARVTGLLYPGFIYGPALLVAVDGPEFASLTAAQLEVLRHVFDIPEEGS